MYPINKPFIVPDNYDLSDNNRNSFEDEPTVEYQEIKFNALSDDLTIPLLGQKTLNQKTLNWSQKAIRKIESFEDKFNKVYEIGINQLYLFIAIEKLKELFDSIGHRIDAFFLQDCRLGEFSQWLDDLKGDTIIKKIEAFLFTLPLKAARNIIRLIYDIIKTALHAAVHPADAVIKIAKLLVTLAYELTKPETWSKMGAGMLGASLGQALVCANPISAIGLGIGLAMLLGGLTYGAVKAALAAEEENRWQEVKNQLIGQLQDIPEAMLTGFIMGLLMGAIQKVARKDEPNLEEARKLAKKYYDKELDFWRSPRQYSYSQRNFDFELKPNGAVYAKYEYSFGASWTSTQDFVGRVTPSIKIPALTETFSNCACFTGASEPLLSKKLS